MIFSAQQLFSDDQAITATAISENVIDLGVAGTPFDAAAALNQDYGKGNPIQIGIQVTEVFNTLTTLTVTVEVDSTADLATAPVVVATEVIALADLIVGKRTFLQFLPEGIDQRYLGLRYTVTGTDPTTGEIHAGINMGNQSNFTGG